MFRRMHAFGLVTAMVIAGSVVAQAAPAFAKASEHGFQGSAYGTQVDVNSTVRSGRSALSVLGCVTQPGVTQANTVVSVTAPEVSTGTIDTSAASRSTGSGVASASSSTIQTVSL